MGSRTIKNPTQKPNLQANPCGDFRSNKWWSSLRPWAISTHFKYREFWKKAAARISRLFYQSGSDAHNPEHQNFWNTLFIESSWSSHQSGEQWALTSWFRCFRKLSFPTRITYFLEVISRALSSVRFKSSISPKSAPWLPDWPAGNFATTYNVSF